MIKRNLGWVVDFGTGKVDSAHGRSRLRRTSPMGGVHCGLLGSKGYHSTDDSALVGADPAYRCALFAHLCESNLIIPFAAPSCCILVRG